MQQAEDLPSEYGLEQNYPNPFNPATRIRYQIPEDGQVRLVVYDLLGRIVQLLVSEHKAAGIHTVTFDGSGLASGLYLYKLEVNGYSQTMKLNLIK